MFKIICNSGGCVGINLYPPFLTEKEKCLSTDAIRHIEHFLSLGGENHIGIGADFDGTENILPEDIHGCEELYRIFDLLEKEGYSNELIEKISHKNFERIFEKGN
jgi:membrane dipeptidase